MFRNPKGSTQIWLNDLGICLFVLIGLTLATHPIVITAWGRLMYDESIWPSIEEMKNSSIFISVSFLSTF